MYHLHVYLSPSPPKVSSSGWPNSIKMGLCLPGHNQPPIKSSSLKRLSPGKVASPDCPFPSPATFGAWNVVISNSRKGRLLGSQQAEGRAAKGIGALLMHAKDTLTSYRSRTAGKF